MWLGCKESVRLQPVNDPVDIRLRLHTKTFGNNFVRRRYAVDTNVSLNEVQYELSAFSHADSLNVLTNVRKGFKQNFYIPRGCGKNKRYGGCCNTNVLSVWGKVIVSVE